MGSERLHESRRDLSAETIDLHRGIISLIEELEAVDWYQQRAEACGDAELRRLLIHHRDEEMEHAMMNLEWLRRRLPELDAHMRTYLFTEGSLVDVEHADTGKALPDAGNGSLRVGAMRAPDVPAGEG